MNKRSIKTKFFSCKSIGCSLLVLLLLAGPVYSQSNGEPVVKETQQQETRTLRGKVIDKSTREPLAGVSIGLKGTTVGTTTKEDGTFSLQVPAASTSVLVVQHVGFKDAEMVVQTTTNDVVIEMEIAASTLDEVRVVGYGTQRERNVTGSVVRANLESFKDVPNTNLAQSLQGTIPGLNVGPVTSSGSTPNIQVRGRNTINGNQSVLIILDGIQYRNDLSSINPDDIESIDLLKDASSTAVYGAQAANGVLLITTKKGKYNSAPKINFTSSYATQQPAGNNRPMNREEFLDYIRKLYYDKAFIGPDYTIPNPDFNIAEFVHRSHANAGRTELVDTDFDWYKEGTKIGFINDNQLSISGGGEKVSYQISGGYTNQAGFIINDLFERKSIRSNIETKPLNWLKIGVQGSGSFVNKDGSEPDIAGLFNNPPLNSAYDQDGSYAITPIPTTLDLSPFLTYDVSDYERHNYFTANTYAIIDFPFIKGLTYQLNFGNNYRTDKRYYFSKYDQGQAGRAFKQDEQYYDYTLDNILTYNRRFNQHNITATLLYGAIERKYDYTNADGIGFSSNILGYNNLGLASRQFINSNAWREALEYQMGRVNYAFSDRYLLTATLRRDGFSGFAKNNKYALFPSFSAGWIFSDESIFDEISWLQFGKLRFGYGLSGNQTPRYSSLDIVRQQPAYIFGDGGSTEFGQWITTLANPDLKWEKTKEINLGLDFTILNNRLSGTVEFYNRHTNDLLFAKVLPQTTGFGSIQSNVGEIGNKGFEIFLNSKNINNEKFKWNTTFSFSRNINKVLSLLGSGDLISSSLFIGEPLGAIYGYRVDGIYQIGEEIPSGFYPGTYRVVDLNGDGKYDASDREVLGSDNPAYRLSLLNTILYKNFTLSFFINSIQGGKNGYLGSNSQSEIRSEAATRRNHNSKIDYWSPANPDGEYPLFLNSPVINPSVYKDRSFIRIQDVTLSYNFKNQPFFKRAGFDNLSCFISAKNLYTWTKWKGWDPEISPGVGNGLGNGGRPLIKGYSIGISTTF